MKSMKTLKEILCKELDEFAYNGQVSRSDLETIRDLTESIKNICKINMFDEQGSSYDGGSGRSGSYGSYGSYGRGGSYGSGYPSRNSRGTSETSGRGGRYSYGDDNEMVTQKLEEMMSQGDMSPDEEDIVRRAMDILRK